MAVPPGCRPAGGEPGRGSAGSGAGQAGERGAGLGDLLLGHRTALGDGLGDAVLEVLVEQPERDRLQGLGRGGDLGEHVDAVLVVLDHARDADKYCIDVQYLSSSIMRAMPRTWPSMRRSRLR